MNFATLQSTYLVAVSRSDLVTQRAVIAALQKLARTNSTLPAWVTALGIEPARPAPGVTAGPGTLPSALERSVIAAKAQRLLTASAFGPVDDAALDSALTLDPVTHAAAAQAIARLTAAAAAARPAGAESPTHAAWAAKAAAIEPVIARAKAQSGQPGTGEMIGAMLGALGREPPFDDGGAATQAELATALGAVRLLLDV